MEDVTREDYEQLGRTLITVQEEVKAARAKGEAQLKEAVDKVTADVEGVRKAEDEIGKTRKLSAIANDYGLEGRALAERVMADTGPSARAMMGQPLSREDQRVLDYQQLCDNMLIFASAAGIDKMTDENLERALTTGPNASEGGRRAWERFKQMRVDFSATDTEFASTGWIPTVASPQLQNRYTLALKVAALFQSVTMPHSPFEFPVLWARSALTNMYQGEATADSARYTGTQATGLKMTFTAKKFMHVTYVSDESNWESIVALSPVILQDHADILAYGKEYTLLNGDTAGTHMDTDIEALGGAHAAAAILGLRGMALDYSCATDLNSTDEFDTETLRGARSYMGKYGVIPGDVALVVGPKSYIALLSNSDVKTLDVFGPKATVLQGQLANFDGHPVIVSEAQREDISAAGYNGASGNTFASYLYVNHKMFKIGQRLGFESKYSDTALMLYGAHAFVSRERWDFQPILTPSTTNSVLWMNYDVTP